MDRRREDLDKRQVGLEGLCQRPRTAHGARAAAHLPALAARRGDPEDRGRTDDGRRLRRRFIGRHHQDHAPQTPRERVGRVAVDAHHTERAPPLLYAERQHQHPHGAPRPLCLGVGRPGKGHGRLGRTHRLHHGRHEPHVPFGNRRTRPQLRRQHRLGIRNKPQAQHRRRVRILAQQRKGPERLLHRLHGRGRRDPYAKPLRHAQHPQQLFGDVQLHLQARHARVDAQAAGRLHAPRNGGRQRQFQPHHLPHHGRRLDLPRQLVEPLRHHDRHAGPRQEILAPLVAARRRQVHLQRHAQRRALRIREGRRVGAQTTTRASRSTIRRTSRRLTASPRPTSGAGASWQG